MLPNGGSSSHVSSLPPSPGPHGAPLFFTGSVMQWPQPGLPLGKGKPLYVVTKHTKFNYSGKWKPCCQHQKVIHINTIPSPLFCFPWCFHYVGKGRASLRGPVNIALYHPMCLFGVFFYWIANMLNFVLALFLLVLIVIGIPLFPLLLWKICDAYVKAHDMVKRAWKRVKIKGI